MNRIALMLGGLLVLTGCKKSEDTPTEDVGTTNVANFFPQAANVGATITIIGSGFSTTPANNRVVFTAAEAPAFFFRKGTYADTLKVQVPAGAVTGPLTVKVYSQSATSRYPFILAPGRWTRKANFPGGAGMYGAGFTLGGKTYSLVPGTNEMWAYEPALNAWEKKAACPVGNVPLTSRSGEQLSFVAGSYAYVGVYLYNYPVDEIRFYRYDPASNTWAVAAPLSRIDAHHGIVFGLGGKGYLLDTYPYTKGMWEYAPATNSWTRKSNFPGVGRYAATGFSIGTKGYLGGGDTGTSSTLLTDFWEYDSASDTWARKADLPDTNYEPNGFTANGLGYMLGGGNNVFAYNPATNTWAREADFTGSAFTGKVCISADNKAYVVRGRGVANDTYVEFWQFLPN